MADFNRERAIARYTELSSLIHVGAYDERDDEGNYGEDGIEKQADELVFQTAQHGLAFHWHKDTNTYTLEPLSDENKAAFLHVNVEGLVSILAETAQYLNSLPYESEMDKNYRGSLNKRIQEALEQSYRVPVVREVPPGDDIESIEQHIQELNQQAESEA